MEFDGEIDYPSGAETRKSYHLEGYTVRQQHAIWAGVTGSDDDGADQEWRVMVRGYTGWNYPIGRVIRNGANWFFRYTGCGSFRTMYPARSKTAAIRAVVTGYAAFMGYLPTETERF